MSDLVEQWLARHRPKPDRGNLRYKYQDQCEAVVERIETLEAALREIASQDEGRDVDAVAIARAALGEDGE